MHKHGNIFFNAHHSPVGAFATFTLGCKGPRGGFGLELAGPANEDVYIGVEERDEAGVFRALPFYGGSENLAENYDVEGLSKVTEASAILPFADSDIQRRFTVSSDSWQAGDLTFRIISPPRPVPDPVEGDVRDAVCPSVVMELTIDNRQGKVQRRCFVGFRGSDRAVGMRLLEEDGLVGFGMGSSIAIATEDASAYAGLAWQPEVILDPISRSNLGFMLGNLGLIVGTVEPGEVKTFTYAVGFFRDGLATTGIQTRYLYRRWFNRVEDVLNHALAQASSTTALADDLDARLSGQLSEDRAFALAHSIHSYFGSTQLLEREDGKPLWVVHEGEYRMMNTFDLTVDQAFFELALNPWTVRNVLDQFVERYSYVDEARMPGQTERFPAGIAFTHDMGVANAFSPAGRSGYEQAGLNGCFSYMSVEETMNWVLCAGLYTTHTGDWSWADTNRLILKDCLQSLQNRDHPNPKQRNGVTSLDGARCEGGAEITTYDSLDASLGQARNNLYLAVKGWATYRVLEHLFDKLHAQELARSASHSASLAARTIVLSADEDGLLPAVIDEGINSRIIPAIEALVYPHVCGIPTRHSDLMKCLKTHFQKVLDHGLCRFSDGGWRLSSTSRNSWLSKIYLCQFVSEEILEEPVDVLADRAHVAWLLEPENAYYAWSDQMLEGKAVGSRYYPRGVTSVLWLAHSGRSLQDISRYFISDSTKVKAR